MSSPYVGEIRMFGGNFAPAGWAFCDGQLIAISENEVLFQLLGTTYGGDGQSTFALPDLQGRIPIHVGTNANGVSFVQGQKAGAETVTLTTQQIPSHSHPALANSGGNGVTSPANNFWGAVTASDPYSNATPDATMNAASIGFTGGNQPHDNMMPYQCVNFIISLFGIFPTQ
jgi:microcystin-dependent protein